MGELPHAHATTPWWHEQPLPKMLDEAEQAFASDLQRFMETHRGQWVAYHGSKRLGFGRSQIQLEQACLAQGLSPYEFVVHIIEPQVDVVDALHDL
jgi:hypothetical protein